MRRDVKLLNTIELAEVLQDGYNELGLEMPDNFGELCESRNLKNLTSFINRISKLELTCDIDASHTINVLYYYDQETDDILNLKLCEECMNHYGDYYANQIEREVDEQDIKVAEDNLKEACSSFLEDSNTPFTNLKSKVYIFQLNGIKFADIDYIGFTCTDFRLHNHLALLEVFRKFKIIVNDGYYSKYSKWANIIDKNLTIYITIVSYPTTIPNALLKRQF